MTQVIQMVIEQPALKQVRNLTLAIIELAKCRNLTPAQYQARMDAIDMLAHEAHDTIIQAECQLKGKKVVPNDSLSWRANNA
jgi:hypothetical protein